MLYWQDYVKSGCAIAGFHCIFVLQPQKAIGKQDTVTLFSAFQGTGQNCARYGGFHFWENASLDQNLLYNETPL